MILIIGLENNMNVDVKLRLVKDDKKSMKSENSEDLGERVR